MLLSAIVIVLREVLEAALLVSLLLTASIYFHMRIYWFVFSLVAGLMGAFLYAHNLMWITELFDYTGQEIVNVFIHITIYICLAAFVIFSTAEKHSARSKVIFRTLLMIIPVALSITLEGSEVVIYISGFVQAGKQLQSVITGSIIGFGIGVSVGVLVYFGLLSCKPYVQLVSVKAALTIISAGILSQAVALLLQADILPSYAAIWDTSNYLSEETVIGQVLYAVVGYEATPAPQQVAIYILGIMVVVTGTAFRIFQNKRNMAKPNRDENTYDQ